MARSPITTPPIDPFAIAKIRRGIDQRLIDPDADLLRPEMWVDASIAAHLCNIADDYAETCRRIAEAIRVGSDSHESDAVRTSRMLHVLAGDDVA